MSDLRYWKDNGELIMELTKEEIKERSKNG